MNRGSGANTYWCTRCEVVCSVRYGGVKKTVKQRSSRFCMVCGESINLIPYDQKPKHTPAPFVFWTASEEKTLKAHMENGLTTSQIAREMGRSVPSVYHKKKQIKLGRR